MRWELSMWQLEVSSDRLTSADGRETGEGWMGGRRRGVEGKGGARLIDENWERTVGQRRGAKRVRKRAAIKDMNYGRRQKLLNLHWSDMPTCVDFIHDVSRVNRKHLHMVVIWSQNSYYHLSSFLELWLVDAQRKEVVGENGPLPRHCSPSL